MQAIMINQMHLQFDKESTEINDLKMMPVPTVISIQDIKITRHNYGNCSDMGG